MEQYRIRERDTNVPYTLFKGTAGAYFNTKAPCSITVTNTITGLSDITCDTTHEYEYIKDVTCTPGGDQFCNKFKWKPVEHIRYVYIAGTPLLKLSNWFPRKGSPTCAYGKCQWRNSWVYSPRASEMKVKMFSFFDTSSKALLPRFFNEAELMASVRRIQPSLKKLKMEQTNIYTILLELGDIKKLLPGITDAIKHPPKGKNASHNAAGAWLTWNWGVAPLLSELNTINALMHSVDSAIDKWNDFASKSKIMNFHDTITFDNNSGSSVVVTPSNGIDAIDQTYSEEGVGEYSAKLALYIKPQLITDADRFRIIMAATGMSKPFSGVWEAVPFSWLIDYVTNVGAWISSVEDTALKLFRYSIVDCGVSEKFNLTYTYHFEIRGFIETTKVSTTMEYESYNRYSLSPSIFGASALELNWDPNLTPDRVTNITAVGRNYWH